MKVGYFTQCVNHTVILENIQAESDGFTMKYDSVTWGAEKVSEGTWGINIWTCNFNLHLFGVFDKGDKWSQNGVNATNLDVEWGESAFTTGETPDYVEPTPGNEKDIDNPHETSDFPTN
jgi:hypothetical protein